MNGFTIDMGGEEVNVDIHRCMALNKVSYVNHGVFILQNVQGGERGSVTI